MSWDRGVCSGAMSWEGVQLSCSLTCSRMYCWQKQQGRSRVPPEHSQPHERMMVDYLQEMSYIGPLESEDSTLGALLNTLRKEEEENPSLSCLLIEGFFEIHPENKTSHIYWTQSNFLTNTILILFKVCVTSLYLLSVELWVHIYFYLKVSSETNVLQRPDLTPNDVIYLYLVWTETYWLSFIIRCLNLRKF